jgi:hypothetical protein
MLQASNNAAKSWHGGKAPHIPFSIMFNLVTNVLATVPQGGPEIFIDAVHYDSSAVVPVLTHPTMGMKIHFYYMLRSA